MLFQKNIVKKYLAQLAEEQVTEAWEKYKAYFLNAEIQQNIRQSKEEQFQEGFLRELFVKVLGYTLNPSTGYNLITEKKNETDSKKADGAILLNDKVVGVIELKDHKTTDLSKVETQAFGYKSKHEGTRLVIISNFEKLRLYIDNAVNHEEWNLFTLNFDGFQRLYLCLAWPQVEQGIALRVKAESVSSEDQITNSLYRDYSRFKRELFSDIVKRNPWSASGPLATGNAGGLPANDADEPSANDAGEPPALQWQLLLFKKTQKLLDRLLFIFFAEDCGLLPPNSMVQIIDQWEILKDEDAYVPFYDRVKKYFGYMNTGFKGKRWEVFAYNGGLFKPDEVLDSITISDELLVEHTRRLSTYDFESDVDVNILGHIFENSLSEIEEVTQQIMGNASGPLANSAGEPPAHRNASGPLANNAGEPPALPSKRKQDGVFYTPQYITKYIVENTVGRLCTEKKLELNIDDIGAQAARLQSNADEPSAHHQRRQMQTKRRLLDQLQQYREWLLQITILDPACGSGAFLNAALQFLMAEHKLIDEMEAKITGSAIEFQGVENSILENNLFGVDINEESVEIAQLALWLRTAKPHRKLSSLNQNIKCGNSLISDPVVGGPKAFDWQQEFPQVFGSADGSPATGNAGGPLANIADGPSAHRDEPSAHRDGPSALQDHCRGYLPHMENKQYQFITYRLYDSLPKEVVENFKASLGIEDEKETNNEQRRKLQELIDKYEDAGYGQCFLKDERIASMVVENLKHFHGQRYNLICWCIMPNHVHVLIEVYPGVSLSDILHSWRSYTAHRANEILGRKGSFWMHDYFDRYIRNARHYEQTISYILNNPVNAGLVSSPDDWKWSGNAGGPPANGSASGPLADSAGELPAYPNAGEPPALQGFDVIIGNPPYVRADSPGNSRNFRNHMTSCGRWETLSGKWDLYIPFLELAVKLSKPGGLCSFIIPDAYCHAEYGKRSLDYMKSHHYLSRIDYFPDIEVFQNVGVRSVIVSFDKRSAWSASDPGTASGPGTAGGPPANDAGEPPAHRSASGPLANRADEPSAFRFVQRIHDASHRYVEKTFDIYPDNLRIDAKRRLLESREGMIPLGSVCYITKGIVGNSDEKHYKGEFLVGDLLSDVQDATHHKLYYEGKDISNWRLQRARYIEYGTDRSPSRWSRKGFTEMFEGGPKLVTMRSPGAMPRTMLDADGGYFNESAIGFKRWIDLRGVENNSLQKAYRDNEERTRFEQLSAGYSYKTLLAIFNSSLFRYELNTERRSNIHIYPDDWKRLVLPRSAGGPSTHPVAGEPPALQLDALADTMLSLHADLQKKRSQFLRRLTENIEGIKINGALEQFDHLTFADFAKQLKAQKHPLSLAQQDEWEEYFAARQQQCRELEQQIADTDREIDLSVYHLYNLTYDEVLIVDPATSITREGYESEQ